MSARKLLVIDTSYAYEAIVSRQLEASVTCRDLNGFFEHVWTVHPFASLVAEGATPRFGRAAHHSLGALHTFIDGKVGRFEALSHLPSFNFVTGQSTLFASLVRLIRKEKISVIRAGDPLYSGLLGVSLAGLCRIPLVVRVGSNLDAMHATTGQPASPKLFRSIAVEKRVMTFVLSRADLVAAVNQDNLNFALANGARAERATIFRYGNLIDKRHVAEPSARPRDPALLAEFWPEPFAFLLHIGRLEPIKRPDDVIRSFAEVRRRGHEAKLLLVGDGQERAALEALCRELGVVNHVAFCGNRDQRWLSQVIPQAAVVVSPITGRALSEAAFGAAPIVAYDLDWQGELIRTGETGELVPARDWHAMALSIERFLTDVPYARQMGDAVRRRAFAMLDPDALDSHERDEYTRLLA